MGMKNSIADGKIWKILIWLVLLFFFIYSFRTIIDLEQATNPRRLQAFVRVLTVLAQPNLFDSEISQQVTKKMWETIQIAFLATVMSAIFAIPLTFLSARTSSLWGRGFNILLQPILAAVRSIHPLITVIPAIILLGIDPTSGVLAITLFSTAVLIPKFSEYAKQHASLNWITLLTVHFPGIAFRRLPANLLIATVIGFMGGGGIGFLLQQWINLLEYGDASVAIIAIIISVGSIDLLSRAVWQKIQNAEPPQLSTSE